MKLLTCFLCHQNEIHQQAVQLKDLRTNLEAQITEATKAKDELKTALTTMEQLKEWYKSERVNWDTEKAGLVKRAEEAEAALKPVTEELTGLKRQVHAMTSAIFGKRIAHLGSDVRKKLKASYTLIEQLYTGAQRVICATSYDNTAPSLIRETLDRLSMIPGQLEEMKRSAARAGTLLALTRAKAWIADLDPADIAKGFPSAQENGEAFDNDTLKRITKEVRPLASQLAAEANLEVHRSFYDANNKRVEFVIPEVQSLIPPIRKHTYAPDVDPAELISEEAVFQALTRIDWSTNDFRASGEEEEEAEPTPGTVPSTSRQPGGAA